MPFKTPSGDCYHSVEGCYGAMEPCPVGGGLAPCSVCCGRGEGVIAGGSPGGGEGSYEEDIPGAYARKYANSVAGYPKGVFKTADGIIRNRYGHALSRMGVKSFLDDARRLRDEQARRVKRSFRPSPEDVDYLGQLELQVQCFEAAYSDASQPEYEQKFWTAESSIEPIEPDTKDESFFEKRGRGGVIPKLVRLRDAYGQPFEISSTRLAAVADASLMAMGERSRQLEDVSLAPDEIAEMNQRTYERWRQVPTEDRPQLWHLQPTLGVGTSGSPEAMRALGDYIGVDDPDDVGRLAFAVRVYCGGSFGDIKRAQRDGRQDNAAQWVEEYIALAPKWAGGTTWRGMAMTPGQVDEIMAAAETGGEYQPTMGTTGSWSTDYEIGKAHATSRVTEVGKEKGRTEVVMFECPTQRVGTSVAHLSPAYYRTESEVLVSKDARYRVSKVRRGSDGIVHVLLEEIGY